MPDRLIVGRVSRVLSRGPASHLRYERTTAVARKDKNTDAKNDTQKDGKDKGGQKPTTVIVNGGSAPMHLGSGNQFNGLVITGDGITFDSRR